MKSRKYIAEYSRIGVGAAVMGGIGGIAGAPASGVVGTSMQGLNLLATGQNVAIAGDLMKSLKKKGFK